MVLRVISPAALGGFGAGQALGTKTNGSLGAQDFNTNFNKYG
jgi:hypothetical protein